MFGLFIGLLFVVAIIAFFALGIPFLIAFGEGRRGEAYHNYDEGFLVAWSVDKGFSFGEYWTRTFHNGRKKTNYGKEFEKRRGVNRGY